MINVPYRSKKMSALIGDYRGLVNAMHSGRPHLKIWIYFEKISAYGEYP